MNPRSESRFLRSFLTVVASLVLVCGGLVLLTSTAPWTPRQEVADGAPPVPQAELAIAPSETENGGQSLPAETVAEASSSAEIQVAQAEPGAPESVQYAASETSTTQSEEAVVAASPQFAEPEAVESEAIATESMMIADPGTEAGTAPADTPGTDVVAETESPDRGAPATPVTVQTVTVETVAVETVAAETVAVETTAAAKPESEPATQVAVETTQAADPNNVAPATTVAAEATEAADQSSESLAESPAPAAIATETVVEDANHAADAADAQTAAPAHAVENTSAGGDAAKPEIAETLPLPPPPPPLPKRKPSVESSAATEATRSAPQAERPARADAPKQAKAAPVVAQHAPAQPGNGVRRWFPMALAPADKPVATQPKARAAGAAYSSTVWGALARHKPRAGQSGSATVVFSIGPSGALSGVRIGKSSGNTKIDQLALATVRGAAPFPRPPSGPASFSIRIDF
jgi:protein TonB